MQHINGCTGFFDVRNGPGKNCAKEYLTAACLFLFLWEMTEYGRIQRSCANYDGRKFYNFVFNIKGAYIWEFERK